MECKVIYTAIILIFFDAALAQENAASSVAPSLLECYDSYLQDRNSRLPSTINILIDLIRKVEDGPTSLDARQLAIQLIHRFRQDGIVHYATSTSAYGFPYSPRGKQADKNKILLTQLIPGNAYTFPNETLTPLERCSLHFMLSNTIALEKRGDESTVCSRLARYTLRSKREVPGGRDEDVETFDPNYGPLLGNLLADGEEGVEEQPEEQPEAPTEEEQPADEPTDDVGVVDVEYVPGSTRAVNLNEISDCPLESGVIYTQWGAVQAGTVIASLAAGYEKQEISTTLDSTTYTVDNRYAASLAGDLSEAALHQGSRTGTITIGASGGWNSTTVPRHYFIEQKENWEATDADIRAGLDGLIMALNVESWKSSVSSLKISQILDLYYSPRGVFNTSIRACNRKLLQTDYAPTETLKSQTIAFNSLLDNEARLTATLRSSDLIEVGGASVDTFLNYLPSSLNDLSCTSTGDTVERAASDVIIVLDTQWTYSAIQPALAYFLDNIDVNKYGSNYTLIAGSDGSLIVNSSYSIVDFHSQYNLTVHQQYSSGFDYIKIFTIIQEIVEQRINNNTSSLGGKSTVVLFVPYSSPSSDEQKTFIGQRKDIFRTYRPDIRLLVLGNGNKDSYADVVFDPTFDIFILSGSSDSTFISSTKPVVTRLKEFPRSIVNPTCKSDWSGSTSSNTLDQYVEPGTVNYYRIAPNYYYSTTGDRYVKVRGAGYGNLVVCKSTTATLPKPSDTDAECTTISSDEVSYSLNNVCNGYSLISACPPFYFSVTANDTSNVNYRCTDSGCRFPDNLKFTVTTENFGCASSAIRFIGSFSLLIIATVAVFLR